MRGERNSNFWREYAGNAIYIGTRVQANDVIAKQQIGESEIIKINHLIREASIYCSLHTCIHYWLFTF